jgi:predicted RNA binding protein YcfA (HicA-like mRNA interferase family)
MKLPREVSGKDLVRALESIGYERLRSKGSHVTLVSQQSGEHHITVPLHNPLKLGMFAGIIGDVARHRKISKEELVKLLFG